MHGPIEDVYRRIQGTPTVVAQMGANFDKGLSIIRSNPDVRDVQVDGQNVTIEFATPESETGNLLKTLVNQDVEVNNFGIKEPNLEDVFMMVTKGLVS